MGSSGLTENYCFMSKNYIPASSPPEKQGFSQKGVQPSYGRPCLEYIKGKFT